MSPKYDATTYAIVTSIVTYHNKKAPELSKITSCNGDLKVKGENGNISGTTSKHIKARKRKSIL